MLFCKKSLQREMRVVRSLHQESILQAKFIQKQKYAEQVRRIHAKIMDDDDYKHKKKRKEFIGHWAFWFIFIIV